MYATLAQSFPNLLRACLDTVCTFHWDHLPQSLGHKISTVSSVSNQQALLQAVITVITLACALIFNMAKPIHENTIWDKRETDKMMEYLQDNVALAGDGGNFKDSTYQATAVMVQLGES